MVPLKTLFVTRVDKMVGIVNLHNKFMMISNSKSSHATTNYNHQLKTQMWKGESRPEQDKEAGVILEGAIKAVMMKFLTLQ